MGAVLLLSCAKDEVVNPSVTGEEVWCNLDFTHKSFSQVEINTKVALDITQESRVLNMFVFLFDADGNRIYSHYFDKNNKKDTDKEAQNANANCWYVYTQT
ncbi:MAG: hypothetical protein IKU18_06420, partial [Bacteroidales bacterium]|nr:hypothetical protein [Bacteroidales bacterium]